MDMTNNDDKLLEKFFSEAARTEIADGGFSRRVMRSLPDRTLLKARLWTAFCLAFGVVMAVGFRVWHEAAVWLAGAVRTIVAADLQWHHVAHLLVAMAVVMALLIKEVMDRERSWW